MKILQLSYRMPLPLKDGGAIGIYNLLQAYHQLGHEVTFVGFNTKKHFVAEEILQTELQPLCKLNVVYQNTDVSILGAINNLNGQKSYHISRFESVAMVKKLTEILTTETFDLIHLDGVFVCPYLKLIRQHSKAKIILRTHNVEHQIWQRLADKVSGLKKWYLNLQTKRLKLYETFVWRNVDVIAAITKEDEKLIRESGCSTKIIQLPAGLNLKDYEVKEAEDLHSFFHIGSMEWQPNIDAVDRLLETVWKNFVAENPTATLHLAGRKMPKKYFTENINGLIVDGEVADAKTFMQTHTIMLVPLRSGGGMRIKIIEAMALGKCIISTAVGAEGINYTDGENIIIANTVNEFKLQMKRCFTDADFTKSIGTAARKLAETEYEQVKLMERFLGEM